jgi:hypothetical protein
LCDAGGGNAARDLDGLRALAEVGDQDAAEQLATLMADQGRGEEAERLCQFGSTRTDQSPAGKGVMP